MTKKEFSRLIPGCLIEQSGLLFVVIKKTTVPNYEYAYSVFRINDSLYIPEGCFMSSRWKLIHYPK